MSEIDAAELARLRGLAAVYVGCANAFSNGIVLSLIDALEKARGDLEVADETIGKLNSGAELQELMRLNNAVVAERDSARALLREAGETLEHVAEITGLDHPSLRIRIAAELETKP